MIAVLRIDDRLIHAQVVIGWGRDVNPDRIVVADDRVSASEWEKSLYMNAASPDIKVSILSLRDAVDRVRGGVFDREKVIFLVRSPQNVLRLIDLGLEIDEVNVGGLHYGEGKEKLLDHLYVSKEERSALRELVKRGVTLEARALPEHEPVILNSRVV
jgi:mannose/fructose/N-acetylgalactosamine-specific phosphotransferase system component IIB